MKGSFLDRVSGKTGSLPSSSALPGQFLVIADGLETVRSVPATPGDYVPRGDDGAWLVSDPAAGTQEHGSFCECGEIPKREAYSLREIGRKVRPVLESSATTRELLAISPAVMGQRATLQPFDRLVAHYLWHLQEVCHKPITHLRSEELLLPVARVRRASLRATDRLAAHTEDWEYRTLAAVIPKRVLAVVSDELFDIYENRLAARLVDKLMGYLRERCEEVGEIAKWFDLDYRYSGTRWRQERVYSLLAEALNAEVDEMEKVVSRTRRTLDHLYFEVLALLDSPLYRAVPKLGKQTLDLQETNILVNDRHYRYVALLWRELRKTEYMRPRSPKQKYEETQELNRGFAHLAMLLVLRGLSLLGFRAEGAAPVRCDADTRWTRGTTVAQVRWGKDDTIGVQLVESDGRILFLPLILPLTANAKDEAVQHLRDQVERLLMDRLSAGYETNDQTAHPFKDLIAVVYPGDSRQRAALSDLTRHKLLTLGNDLVKPSRVAFIPISTFELDSVERIGRALRWALDRPHFLTYPPKIKLPEIAKGLLDTATWVVPAQGPGYAEVLSRPIEGDNRKLTEALKAKRNSLVVKGKKLQHEVAWLDEFAVELTSSYAYFEELLRCPVCQRTNDRSALQAHPGGYFTCTCECGSQWGMKACGSCRERYPFLTPAGSLDFAGARTPGWVDAIYGMDCLAVPCSAPHCGNAHVCPHCGTCGNAGHAGCEACPRCTALTSLSTNHPIGILTEEVP